MQKFLAITNPFFEAIGEDEILSFGGRILKVKKGRGLIFFESTLKTACEITFNTRTLRRILLLLKSFNFTNKVDFYNAIREISWEELFSKDSTFLIKSEGTNDILKNTLYTNQLIKDAIVDRMKDLKKERPCVDKRFPQFIIFAYVSFKDVSIYLDLGGSLHKRGYKLKRLPGTLNETLAASILKFIGYKGDEPLFDPMAGSGTIGIEAALIALNIAPGLLWNIKRGFFFFPFIEENTKKEIVNFAKNRVKKQLKEKIVLSDINSKAIAIAKINAKRANVLNHINFKVENFFKVIPPFEKGCMVTNTPYGDRVIIKEDIIKFFNKMGEKLKKDYKNYSIHLLLGSNKIFESLLLDDLLYEKNFFYNGNRRVILCSFHIV